MEPSWFFWVFLISEDFRNWSGSQRVLNAKKWYYIYQYCLINNELHILHLSVFQNCFWSSIKGIWGYFEGFTCILLFREELSRLTRLSNLFSDFSYNNHLSYHSQKFAAIGKLHHNFYGQKYSINKFLAGSLLNI